MRGRGQHTEAALLESLIAGGLPTHMDLYVERKVCEPACRRCQGGFGTTHHRLLKCAATAHAARDLDFESARKLGAAAPADDLGFMRGLVNLGLDAAPAPSAAEVCLRAALAQHEGFSGTVCVDASDSCPREAALSRCGWAAIVVSEDGRLLGGMCGFVPGAIQEIGFAELHAVFRVLQEASVGALPAVTDCLGAAQD